MGCWSKYTHKIFIFCVYIYSWKWEFYEQNFTMLSRAKEIRRKIMSYFIVFYTPKLDNNKLIFYFIHYSEDQMK